MSQIIPIPKTSVSIRPATLADVPFMDGLQKRHSKALGYFPTQQFEGYVQSGGVLVAEGGAVVSGQWPVASGEQASSSLLATGHSPPATSLGYVISRDRYLKRDELGVIYQLCVAPGTQRKLVGAALVREVFARSAYGCRLYCCWCAQDLEANRFWESMGFVPIAFRAGSAGKGRVHIFWQRRIVDGDVSTPWWYPCQTNQGAIREDRLVFPIPPGTHWTEVEAVSAPSPTTGEATPPARARQIAGPTRKNVLQVPTIMRRQFAAPTARSLAKAVEQTAAPKPKAARAPRAKVKNDPKLVAAARELRDRYLERYNAEPGLIAGAGKYDVGRALPEAAHAATVTTRVVAALPAAA